jgi:hypothetical protein
MTGPYLWAWVIVVLAAPLAMYTFLRATRGLALPGVRRALAWLIGVWMGLPARVPGYPENYAPAFLVFLFESLFQNDGKPRAAGLILVAGALVYAAALLVWVVVRRLRRRPGARVA